MEFLYLFESNEPKIHVRYQKTVILMFTYGCKFLKNGGLPPETDVVSARDVLNVEYYQENLQLSNKEIFLGERVDTFLKEYKIDRNDPVL